MLSDNELQAIKRRHVIEDPAVQSYDNGGPKMPPGYYVHHDRAALLVEVQDLRGRLADCERDLQRLEMERLARHRFIALLKLVLFLVGTAFLAYWGTKHNWWAA